MGEGGRSCSEIRTPLAWASGWGAQTDLDVMMVLRGCGNG